MANIIYRPQVGTASITAPHVHDPAPKMKEEHKAATEGQRKAIDHRWNKAQNALRKKEEREKLEKTYRDLKFKADLAENERYTDQVLSNLETEAENIRLKGEEEARKIKAWGEILQGGAQVAKTLDAKARKNAILDLENSIIALSTTGFRQKQLLEYATGEKILREQHNISQAQIDALKVAAKDSDSDFTTRDVDRIFGGQSYYTRHAANFLLAQEQINGWEDYFNSKKGDKFEVPGLPNPISFNTALENAQRMPDSQGLRDQVINIENQIRLSFYNERFKGKSYEKQYKRFAQTLKRSANATQAGINSAGARSAKTRETQNLDLQVGHEILRLTNGIVEVDETGKETPRIYSMTDAVGSVFTQRTHTDPSTLSGKERRSVFAGSLGRAHKKGMISTQQIQNFYTEFKINGQPIKDLYPNFRFQLDEITKQNDTARALETQADVKIVKANKEHQVLQLTSILQLPDGAGDRVWSQELRDKAWAFVEPFKVSNPALVKVFNTFEEKSTYGLDDQANQRLQNGTLFTSWVNTRGNDDWRNKWLKQAKNSNVPHTPQGVESFKLYKENIVQDKLKEVFGYSGGWFGGGFKDDTFHTAGLEATFQLKRSFAFYKMQGNGKLTGADLEIWAINMAWKDLEKAINDGKEGKGVFKLCDPTKNGGRAHMCELPGGDVWAERNEVDLGVNVQVRAKIGFQQQKLYGGNFLQEKLLVDGEVIENYWKNLNSGRTAHIPHAFHVLANTITVPPGEPRPTALDLMMDQTIAYNKIITEPVGGKASVLEPITYNKDQIPQSILNVIEKSSLLPRSLGLDGNLITPVSQEIGRSLIKDPDAYGLQTWQMEKDNTKMREILLENFNPDDWQPRLRKNFSPAAQEYFEEYLGIEIKPDGYYTTGDFTDDIVNSGGIS